MKAPGGKQQERNRRAQERAIELGIFDVSTDYQYRKLVNAGVLPVLRPERIKKKTTARAQSKFYDRFKAPAPARTQEDRRSGREIFNSYLASVTKEQLCQDWSDQNAVTNVMVFETKTRNRKKRGKSGPLDARTRREVNATTKRKLAWIDKHGKEAYIDVYYRAFVEGGPDSYVNARYNGGSEALKVWMNDICGYLSQDAYDARYSI